MSISPFNELLKAEQQVTTIKVVLHHLEATGLLSEAAMSVDTDVLARQIVGIEEASSDSSPSASAVSRVSKLASTGLRKAAPAARSGAKKLASAAKNAATPVIKRASSSAASSLGQALSAVDSPPCPACGSATVMRRNRKTGHPFFACTAWETEGCTWTAKVDFSGAQSE